MSASSDTPNHATAEATVRYVRRDERTGRFVGQCIRVEAHAERRRSEDGSSYCYDFWYRIEYPAGVGVTGRRGDPEAAYDDALDLAGGSLALVRRTRLTDRFLAAAEEAIEDAAERVRALPAEPPARRPRRGAGGLYASRIASILDEIASARADRSLDPGERAQLIADLRADLQRVRDAAAGDPLAQAHDRQFDY